MLSKLKNRVEKELKSFITHIDKTYALKKTSPLLFDAIKDFVLRKGKRIRPILFLVGYLGFKKKETENLYTSALSIELLHDFMLVHDDIIDKSDTRRGEPSMHKMMDSYLARYKDLKFNGQDLSIVIGDVMYAMAIHAFLSVKEEPKRKEKSLRKLIEAAVHTGCGELIELLSGLKDIKNITKDDIYKIYDLKTASYTFSTPLAAGAVLGGAKDSEAKRLFDFGIYLGRAFQVKDDILGMFGDEKKIGKSCLTDLQEAKKTILVWYAYKESSEEIKSIIRNIMDKEEVDRNDLDKIRKIVIDCGALDYAKKEIAGFIKKAQNLLRPSSINKPYKDFLKSYSEEILGV
ncbi:MAG: polyprenyl synthetase family protein [Candidatus Omnitrophota bacterium]|nr:MAG: polyprenyl synthetase family protein [Candidatus Omnitrophota bacterium]